MNAGKLPHRISIQRATVTRGAEGGEIKTWETVWDPWAKVEPLTGKEYYTSQQLESKVAARIVLRYRPGVTTGMRVCHGALVYDIQSVINVDGANREMHLMASEGAAQ